MHYCLCDVMAGKGHGAKLGLLRAFPHHANLAHVPLVIVVATDLIHDAS